MKNKIHSCLFFSLLISVFTPCILLSQNLKMGSVRVWSSEKKTFGELSDIEIQKGMIFSIRPSSQKKREGVRYLLPGYCDASVTIGADSFGGGVTKDSLPFHLQGFLSTGFSHVESVGDPDLRKVKEEIAKGRLFGPIISQAQKPIVLSSHFLNEDQPKKQYHLSEGTEGSFFSDSNKEDRSRRLPIFLKRHGNESFSQPDLYKLRLEAEKNGFIPVIYSFTDPLSWEDALDAGYKIVFHALPPKSDLDEIQKRSYVWAPLFNVAYLQSLRENPIELKKMMKELAERHPVFKERFYEGFDASLAETAKGELSQKKQAAFGELFQSMTGFPKDRLIFASGSGHYGSYPGIGAMIEAELWLASWKDASFFGKDFTYENRTPSFWQKLWGNFSSGRRILATHKDPESRHLDRISLLEILTVNTCPWIQADHGGVIREGGPAHFSVHKENPFLSPLGIFDIESMVLSGKLVYTPKSEKVGKKR